MKKILLFICSALCILPSAFAQKEANMWYFGSGAGIDFNSGVPVPFSGSAMIMLEGCASIADSNGSTLFYTDGASVWNKNNVAMPNGFGLRGDNNSAQAAIIVPAPGSNTLYYIFTTPTNGIDSMYYNIVDMSQQGGLGDVVTKNVGMFVGSTEKVTAVSQGNGTDFWVIGHEWNTNNFYSFSVTTAGVNLAPVITSSGSVVTGALGFAGYMKASHNGQKLAYASTISMNIVELFDFDNNTGVMSNPITFNNIDQAYGLEFSPDDSKLYATEENPMLIVQWDLSLGSAAAIAASQTNVNSSGSFGFAALQLAPDGKIYLAERGGCPYLGVINNPNAAGVACNFVDNAVTLSAGTWSLYGLPNFYQSLFDTISTVSLPVAILQASDTTICPGSCVSFTNMSQNATTYQWQFPGGSPSSDTAFTPSNVCYDSPGTYTVILTASNGTTSDTATYTSYITVYPPATLPTFTQSFDTLFVQQGYAAYQWYYGSDTIPGATNYFCPIGLDGNYNIIVTDSNGCSAGSGILNVVSGMNELSKGNMQLAIFPNPFYNVIEISFADNSTAKSVFTVSSADGKIVFQEESLLKTKVVDLSFLSKGVYFLTVSKEKNFVVRKIVKM